MLSVEEEQNPVVWASIGEVGLLDDWMFQREDVYHASTEEIERLKMEAIGAAVAHQFAHNAEYRRYCERLNFEPSTLRGLADLARIPLVTSSQFKLREVLTGPPESVVKTCASSGTQGSVSRVHRDETTLSRFFASIRVCVEQLLSVDDAFCLHLGPDRDEAKDLWIAYSMSVTDMMFPTENFVRDEVFEPERVVQRIRAARGRYEKVVLLGAPIMLLHLAEYMEEAGERFDDCDDIWVITAGGWKRFSGTSISPPELFGRLEQRFSGLKQSNFRDFFNMVELNLVIPECESGVKHAPPWLHLLVLSPETLQPVPNGEEGLLAFIDPTPTSYPGFILTDDFARISLDGECGCGRSGQGIEFVRRVNRGESRGCALKMDRTHAKR